MSDTELGPPPSYYESTDSIHPIPMFDKLCQKYEISQHYIDKLNLLKNCRIAYIIDNSSSMSNKLDDTNQTRWQEAEQITKISINIALNLVGCVGVYFLNPQETCYQMKVTHVDQLNDCFKHAPNGYTPIVNALNLVLNDHAHIYEREKLLIMIVTDGAPTDPKGIPNIPELRRIIANRKPIEQIYVTFLACTDDLAAVNYLNKWDSEIQNVDVVDDYKSELKEIKKKQGNDTIFTYGDYIVKAMVGSIDPELDRLDENKCQCLIL